MDGRLRHRRFGAILGWVSGRNHRWTATCPRPPRLVRPVPVDATGASGPTPGQARGPRWRRTSHGLYVPVAVDGSIPEQRIMEQSTRLPDGGAVTGWAACRLWGGNFFDGLETDGRTPIPVPLVVGSGQIRPDEKVRVARDRLPAEEVVRRFGVPCTTRERAVFDAARMAPGLREAVVALDMAAAAEITSPTRVAAYAAGHRGWRGVRQVQRALPLASELSRSPNETRTRLIWVLDAGLPHPLVNRAVFDLTGRLLAIVDLLDVEAGLVGEFDGADHRAASRHSKDVEREDRLRRHGLEYVTVTGPDLADTARVARRILAARQRARGLDPERRRWTVQPPPWWEVAPPLDDVLDRRDALREIHEAQERQPLPDLRTVRGW